MAKNIDIKEGDIVWLRLAYVKGVWTWITCNNDHPDACAFKLMSRPH